MFADGELLENSLSWWSDVRWCGAIERYASVWKDSDSRKIYILAKDSNARKIYNSLERFKSTTSHIKDI